MTNNLMENLEKKQSVIDSLYPQHRFYVICLVIAAIVIITIVFLYINKNNSEMQKEFLSFIYVLLGGGTGGYLGAKS